MVVLCFFIFAKAVDFVKVERAFML